MTEEIIIDGVNVAGCEFYLQDEKYSCDLSFINQEELCKCDDVQDCTYKQLKRLEQENKALKENLEQYKSSKQKSYETLQKRLNDVEWEKRKSEQENKQMKSALEEILEIIRADCKRCTAECDCDDDCTRYIIKNKINEVLK